MARRRSERASAVFERKMTSGNERHDRPPRRRAPVRVFSRTSSPKSATDQWSPTLGQADETTILASGTTRPDRPQNWQLLPIGARMSMTSGQWVRLRFADNVANDQSSSFYLLPKNGFRGRESVACCAHRTGRKSPAALRDPIAEPSSEWSVSGIAPMFVSNALLFACYFCARHSSSEAFWQLVYATLNNVYVD